MYQHAEELFEKAESEFQQAVMSEIERLARLVITEDPKITGFCMAMGSVSFSREYTEYENEDDTEGWSINDDPDPYELDNVNAQAINDILNKWDSKLRITGCPLRLTIDHVTGEINKAYDG